MDCSPPGSSVRGILQARTLEWVAISFSWGSKPHPLCLLHGQVDSLPLAPLEKSYIGLGFLIKFSYIGWLSGLVHKQNVQFYLEMQTENVCQEYNTVG